jgi:hypothetical protein
MAVSSTPISEQERTKREQALAATIANLRIEALYVDDELRRIFQRHVDGEISDEELRAAIDELNERRLGPLPVPRKPPEKKLSHRCTQIHADKTDFR